MLYVSEKFAPYNQVLEDFLKTHEGVVIYADTWDDWDILWSLMQQIHQSDATKIKPMRKEDDWGGPEGHAVSFRNRDWNGNAKRWPDVDTGWCGTEWYSQDEGFRCYPIVGFYDIFGGLSTYKPPSDADFDEMFS